MGSSPSTAFGLPVATAVFFCSVSAHSLRDWRTSSIVRCLHSQPWRSYPGTSYRQVAATLMEAAEQAVFGDGDVAEIMQGAQARAQAMMPGS